MKALYKYPQNEYPYEWLVNENRTRGVEKPEFELLDTGNVKVTVYHQTLSMWLQKKVVFCNN